MSYKNICECGQKWSLLEHVRCPRCSPESAVQPHGCGGLADRVQGLETKIDHLIKGISGLTVDLARTIEALSAVSPVQPTQSASEADLLDAIQERFEDLIEADCHRTVACKPTLSGDYKSGANNMAGKAMLFFKQAANEICESRSDPNNTSDGSDGSLVG